MAWRTPMILEHSLLQRLYAYWDAKRGNRIYPGREEIDPLELRFILGNLILVDIERDPERFRYRLFGTEIARRQGFDMTGKYLEQHPWPELAALARSTYLQVIATGQPAKIHREGLIDDQYVHHDSLVLPLGHEHVEMMLIGVIFAPTAPAK
jgi:hypothetical protein